MGRTWPNVDAETVVEPGYYWNARLKKLARLQIGEKLPNGVGPWEMVAREGEKSSSEVARQLFDRYPTMNINEFTYTTTSPLPRRLPMGDPPRVPRAALIAAGAFGLLALGAGTAWWLTRRFFSHKYDGNYVRIDDLKALSKTLHRKERPLAPAMLELDLEKHAIP